MAVIRDMMPVFELFQPASIDEALNLLDAHQGDVWVLGGGMDSFDWLKDRTKRVSTVVDLSQVGELRGIKEANGGLEIGAMTTLTEVVHHPAVQAKFRILAEAAEVVASPQIRNQATLGGNVSQDTRCWYYRSGWSCYRAGGNICYADTPTAINREHAILQQDRCVAVSPSDTAPALVALDAEFVIRSKGGERVVKAEDYFLGPQIDITHMTVLRPGELLTAIRIPATWANAQFYWEKVRDRNVWDFPLVNVASAMKLSGTTISDVRIAVGAVAARPLRLTAVEAATKGKPRTEETASAAGELAIQGATPLRYNAYKIPLMRNLVKRAIRGNAQATT
ncbi:MAG: xanthine dehydrogenase family protein subunit M [Acidobacteria bacterium]|nr:xanthine dehydrogenase family protein subunit M [Acidobacteriota bacterium]